MPGPFKFLSPSEEDKALKELDKLIKQSSMLGAKENKKKLNGVIARAGEHKLAIIKSLINLLKHDRYNASQSYKKYIDDYMLHPNPQLAVLTNLITAGPHAD